MKRLIKFLVIPILMLGMNSMISCDDDDDPTPSSNTVYTATLTGASETPPNASTATGNATLTFNNTTKIFTLTVTYSGMTPTAAHIHEGAVGQAGDPEFPLEITASPITYTSMALTSEQEEDLKNGLYYVNIHSTAYPDGEIRGQLVSSSTNTVYKATLTGASETPPVTTTATGTATLTYNNSTKIFTLMVTYSGLIPNAGHVHRGAVGESGPPVFPFTITASPINYTSRALTSAEETDLKNGLYYVNLHTEANADGEIRGQLIKQTSGGGY